MSNVHVIRMPDLGEGIAEVELVAWRVNAGDTVAEDQVLADVMTDKANVEIPSPVAGQVLALGGEVGQMMAVGSELIRIALAGASHGPALTAAVATKAPAAPTAQAAPAVAATADVSAAPAASAPAPVAGRRAAATPGRAIASPAVRAHAWDLGIELRDVQASGSGGRIMHTDLDAHVARGGPRIAPRPAATPMAPTAAPPRAPVSAPTDATESVKVVGLRRKIAQKMQDAKRRIPHYSYVEEVDVTELEALRLRLNAQHGGTRGHLTLLAFILRAMVWAARDFPQVNAHFDDDAGVLTRHAAVHAGIATQTDAGLMVPVLRQAQTMDLWAAAAEIVRLAEAARSGKAVRDELVGSTITLTSLGKLGGIVSTPVINLPEVAIVGVNRMVLRPVIRDGAVVARQMMNLSSSFDHRVVDGAYGAGFVQRIRELLEHPATLFIE